MRALRILILLSMLLPLMAGGATLRLSVRAPGVNADNGRPCGCPDSSIVDPITGAIFFGTPLTDLKEIILVGKRFSDRDSLVFAPIPAVGREGDSIAVDLNIDDGSMGSIWSYARDASGNMSCRGAEFVFAFPASEPPPAPPPGTGGLRTQIFSYDRWHDFKALLHERVDTTFAFNWGAGAAFPGGPADYYSMKFLASLLVQTSGTYTFYIDADNGRRLDIAGVRRQDFWTDRSDETSCTVELPAGIHPIEAQMYEAWGNARFSLSISGPGIPKQVIPRGMLQP